MKTRRIVNSLVQEDICPCLQDNGTCKLQRNMLTDEKRQQRFCATDDYDFCPTYLSYLLTHTQALRHDSDWLDAQC